MTNLPRRALLGMAPFALTNCRRASPYFGSHNPPHTQTLIYEIGSEPGGLDPATSLAISEFYLWLALFETLVRWDPGTLEPRAALATHYEVDPSRTEFTFYLRGHPSPRGVVLSGADRATAAALWSDGTPVTAHDFVFAWRRLVDPALGSTSSTLISVIANATDIAAGRAAVEKLGVRAHDELTLRVTLKAAASHFLKIAANPAVAPVPRHVVQQQGDAWTKPGRMTSCGAFVLTERKPYERVVVRKNERYYHSSSVALETIVFLPVIDGSTGVNLYKAGAAHAMYGREVPPLWISALREHRDFHSTPAYRNSFYAFNTRRPPFDNVLLRYAFNMSADRRQITRFLNGGQTPARTLVPPLGGYRGIESLKVEVGGREWDLLAYDPDAGRHMMRMAGVSTLETSIMFPNRPRSKEIAEILQQQWAGNLGVRVQLVTRDWNVWVQALQAGTYHGISDGGFGADWADPTTFLEAFNGRDDGSGWIDPEFRKLVDRASAEPDNPTRLQKLAEAEAHLLRAMPLMPLFFDTNNYLQKPYVEGLSSNILDQPDFKRVRINTDWRPAA